MVKNLFVGNLPYSVTEDKLGSLFSQCGEVVSAKIIIDKYTGQSRGFAFVEMSTEEQAQEAIKKLNGADMDGRQITVKEALPKPAFNNDRGGFPDRSNKRSNH